MKRLDRFGWLTNSSKIFLFAKCVPNFIKIGWTVRPLPCSQTYIYVYIYIYIYIHKVENEWLLFLDSRDLKMNFYRGPGLRSCHETHRNSLIFLWKFAKSRITVCIVLKGTVLNLICDLRTTNFNSNNNLTKQLSSNTLKQWMK